MSRRRLKTILSLCLLIVGFLVWLDKSSEPKSLFSRPRSAFSPQPSDYKKYNSQTFIVVKVVDGDTLDVDCPDGKNNYTRIRLWGVDTPETKKPNTPIMYFGPEASEFTKKLTMGNTVTLYLDSEKPRDRYDRILAYVQLPDKKYLNEVLISEGYAYADLRFQHSFLQRYSQLEAAARSQKKGLWKNITRDQLPEWLQKKKPNLLGKK